MSDPHEDLVARNRAAHDAHQAEIARLASEDPNAGKPEVFPEDQAVLDAKKVVADAQADLVAVMQAAYHAGVRRAEEALHKAAADAEAETAREEADRQAAVDNARPQPIDVVYDDEVRGGQLVGKPPLTPMPVQAKPYVKPPVPAYVRPAPVQAKPEFVQGT
jgi:hypothetical protein